MELFEKFFRRYGTSGKCSCRRSYTLTSVDQYPGPPDFLFEHTGIISDKMFVSEREAGMSIGAAGSSTDRQEKGVGGMTEILDGFFQSRQGLYSTSHEEERIGHHVYP